MVRTLDDLPPRADRDLVVSSRPEFAESSADIRALRSAHHARRFPTSFSKPNGPGSTGSPARKRKGLAGFEKAGKATILPTARASSIASIGLISLPSGGAIIDTPGMRELQLWDGDDGIDRAFSDIAELSTQGPIAGLKEHGGRVFELRAGNLFYVPPVPHDSWVVGDLPYVSLHFLGADRYARSGETPGAA